MANTQGGYLVIGVSELANGFAFDGLTEDQAKTFDTSRVNRFLQSYADPPINTQLRKITHDGRLFVLIEVPAFADTPHITQKDFPGVLSRPTLYVRTANNESAAVRSAADFRSVVEQAIRNRRDALLSSFRSILTSGSLAPQPSTRERYDEQRQSAIAAFDAENPLKPKEPLLGYTEVALMPDAFDANRFSLDTLRGAIDRAQVNYIGWPFLFVDAGRFDCPQTIQAGWETFFQTNDFAGIDMLDFWRLHQSGFFYQRCLLRPYMPKDESTPVADLKMLAVYVGEAIDCLVRLYDQLLDDAEYVTVLFRVLNTRSRTLINSAGMMPLFDMYTCHIDEIIVERRLPPHAKMDDPPEIELSVKSATLPFDPCQINSNQSDRMQLMPKLTAEEPSKRLFEVGAAWRELQRIVTIDPKVGIII